MKVKIFLRASQLCLFVVLTCCLSCNKQNNPIKYPPTFEGDQEDIFFGTTVKDPYRWLENLESDSTKKWINAQNKLTHNYFDQIPYVSKIKKRMTSLWNYAKYSAPFKEGNYTYYYKNNGLQNQFVLYRQKEEGEDEIFINANNFSDDGTVSMSGVSFSHNGKMVAYQIAEGGADWRKIVVMDVESKQIIGDTLTDVKFSSISWKNNEGFYYSSYGRLNGNPLSQKTMNHKLLYHTIGDKQTDDKVIFGEQIPYRYVYADITEDQQYLVIYAAQTTYGSDVYIQKITQPNTNIMPLIKGIQAEFRVVYAKGNTLWMMTDYKAPNSKLIAFDFGKFATKYWRTIIPEVKMSLDITVGGGYFFAHYLKDAISQVKQYSLKGTLIQEITLPDIGRATGFSGKKDDDVIYYIFNSYVSPRTIYALDLKTNKTKVYKQPKVKFKPEDYVSKQVFYTSTDGTKIPMIISHKKNLDMKKVNPLLLYGYGGFNISILPRFSISNLYWMEQGGILAVPNIRGGGEYGKKWHIAGTKQHKKQVFKDFIAAAEYLIEEKITSKDLIAIEGRSNGGLLVGACMTMRPDLFRVALPTVGVLDMLRYHEFTAGAGWAYDYGTANDSKAMFEYLYSYSPVHNAVDTCYPATFVTTADHDDRVVPAHSYKFISTIQKHQICNTVPTLIAIQQKAGHGSGKPTEYIIEENAQKWSFVLWNMGITDIR